MWDDPCTFYWQMQQVYILKAFSTLAQSTGKKVTINWFRGLLNSQNKHRLKAFNYTQNIWVFWAIYHRVHCLQCANRWSRHKSFRHFTDDSLCCWFEQKYRWCPTGTIWNWLCTMQVRIYSSLYSMASVPRRSSLLQHIFILMEMICWTDTDSPLFLHPHSIKPQLPWCVCGALCRNCLTVCATKKKYSKIEYKNSRMWSEIIGSMVEANRCIFIKSKVLPIPETLFFVQ